MLNHDAGWREFNEEEQAEAMAEAIRATLGDYLVIDYRGNEVFQSPTFTVALDKMVQRKRDGYGPDMLQNLARVHSDDGGYGITDDESESMLEAGL